MKDKGEYAMLGEIPWLTWKSKSAQAKEQEEYEQWAFPYGEEHREKVEVLLKEYFPKENKQVALVAFLTCKELYSRSMATCDTYENALKRMKRDMRRYRTVIKKKQMPLYSALAIADARITPELIYPPRERIMELAAEFEASPEEKRKFPYNLFS